MLLDISEVSILEDMIMPEPIAADCETAGLYGEIKLIQLYQKSWDRVLLIKVEDALTLAYLKHVLSAATAIIFHNASYDMSCFQNDGVKWIPDQLQDTFLLSRLAFPRQQSFSLDNCFNYALKMQPYLDAGLVKKEQQHVDWSEDLSPDNIEYACIDVFYLVDLYDVVVAQKDTNSYRLDIKCLRDCLEWQGNGIPVDDTEVNMARQRLQSKIDNINLPDSLNVNSWQQVRKYLDSTESDKLYLKTEALKGNTKADKVITKRLTMKELSFVNAYAKAAEANNGRVKGIFAPTARSGRLTCKNENLQQWPRKLKHLVKCKPGRVLLYSDFDSLEMRCIAALIGDPVLLKILREGLGPHDYVAARMFGENYTEEQRRVAKTENFLLLYGGGIGMLQQMLILQADLLFSFDEVKQFKKDWLDLFSTIKDWHSDGFDDHRDKKLWKTPFGRHYLGKLGTDQLNLQIQGMGAEVAKMGRLFTRRRMEEEGIVDDVLMCSLKHDDYLYEMDDDPVLYEKASMCLALGMQEAWAKMMGLKCIKAPDLDMPIEVDVGKQLSTIDGDGSLYKIRIKNDKESIQKVQR